MKRKLFHKVPPLDAPKQEGEVEFTPLELTRLRWTAINFQNVIMFGAGFVILAAVIAVGSLWYFQIHDEAARKDRTVASCQQGNRHDRDLINKFAIASGRQPNSPEVNTFLDSGLRRDCAPEGIKLYFKHAPKEPPCQDDGKGFCLPPTTTTTAP